MPIDFPPTPEQLTAVELFRSGDNLAIEAGAGTGKTSTLLLLAEAIEPGKRGQYISFNKAIAVEAGRKFPKHVACQPPGTLVRVAVKSSGSGPSYRMGYREIPIEDLADGDRVVSWSQAHSGGFLRRKGSPITVASRWYQGPMITVEADGYESSYTQDHHCLAWLRDSFAGAGWVVYMMRRGEQYRIGLAQWRADSGRSGLGQRIRDQHPDAAWILSAHSNIDDARVAERWAQHLYGVPGWLFVDPKGQANARLWHQLGPNPGPAAACLSAHGRCIEYPLWEKGQPRRFGSRWITIRACNLMDGMVVPLADRAEGIRGRITTDGSSASVTVRRRAYAGMVYSLDVATDHTYVADGIITHNCNTAHSLAFRSIGQRYRHRIGSPRMKSHEIARRLGISTMTVKVGDATKTLAAGYLAGQAMKAVGNFCNSADLEPKAHHVGYIDGIDLPEPSGRRTWANNEEVRRALLPAMRAAWKDLADPEGQLPYGHGHYLKAWHLEGPVIPADVIFFDEAQDANPVLLAIVSAQTHAQLVFVGDSQQQIYEFTGAVNALASVPADLRAFLTQSFRFGPAIAAQANNVLTRLGAELRIRGFEPIASTVGPLERPTAILCRTNAKAVSSVLAALKDGERVHLVGGGGEVTSFARAAIELKAGQRTYHPELACFESWGEVQDYCLAPGTLVLTADLRWQPIELLGEGDELVGFQEENEPGNGGRRFETVKVESSRIIERPAVQICADDGTVMTASIEHRWLVRSGGNLRWKQSKSLRAGDRIVSIGKPWAQEETWEAGWLAGMFDGEGCVVGDLDTSRTRAVSIAQLEGPTLDRVRSGLKARGFRFGDYGSQDRARQLWIGGGIGEELRLLGSIRPERLVAKAERLWKGRRVERITWATVTSVQPVGIVPVVSVQTSGRTFIAEGWLSHNCSNDPQGSDLKLLVGLVDDYGPETIIEALDRSTPEASASLIVSTAHKSKGREWESVQLASDISVPDEGEPSEAEWRLLYVAATRAKLQLDVSLAPAFGLLAPPEAAHAPQPQAPVEWFDTASGAPVAAPAGR